MAVYIINNMTIHDRASYKAYLRAFMPVFSEFSGTVLAAQNHPEATEGQWPFDRTILLSFPSREEAERWSLSAQYQAIASLRRAGVTSNIVLLEGIA